MIRKFFVAVILAVFMLNAQIAAASVDWNSAPKISSKAQLARYIENGRRKGQTVFHVVITNDSILPNAWKTNVIDKNDFADILPCLDWELLNSSWINGKILGIHFKLIEYPGTRVANAYLSRESHMAWKNLTAEEQKLYNIAVGIVDEAKKRSSEIEKARYIYDEICKRVLQYKNENDRNKTAIGALIDGYAQCQGFSDVFYMLGRMSGLNIGRIGGLSKDENGQWTIKHGWNWITFNNGKSYCVDVTNGFNTKGTYLFCATKERIEKTHQCEWSIIPNLQ